MRSFSEVSGYANGAQARQSVASIAHLAAIRSLAPLGPMCPDNQLEFSRAFSMVAMKECL